MKLLVWSMETGQVETEQNGSFKDDVIDKYAAIGRTARPIKENKHPLGHIFFDGKKITKRPVLNAKLDKTNVRAGDTVKLKGVPAGAHVVISDGLNSERHGPTNGAVVQMLMQDRGRRVIEIRAFPHLHQTLHLNVE